MTPEPVTGVGNGPGGADRYPPIGDYAIIGDCRTAALISRRGSLDWLCLPRFDSPSMFGAILDAEKGGRFAVRPSGRFSAERRYLPGTPVLETTFTTEDGGRARLLDLMTVASEADKRRSLQPDHEVLRAVECLEGEVELEVVCDPRPQYGRTVPRLLDRQRLGIYYENGADLLSLRSDIPLRLGRDPSDVCGRVRLRPGERRYVSLVFTHGEPAVFPCLGERAEERIRRSVRWWQNWSSRCRYEGPYRDPVVRSAITLKLMTYAPSGAVVAAPTTSLPETIGGTRNWDYRFCWLRDASLTLQALDDLGYEREAQAFVSWLLHTTRLTSPELQVVYDVFGATRLREQTLDHLEGYAGSRPVRIGNGAHAQLQLDTYGEVAHAVYEFVARGGRIDRSTARFLVGLGRTVCQRWREPDEGIWEIRAARRHHTYSKVMCWVALDRLIRLHEGGHVDVPVARFARERDAIRRTVETEGYNQRLRSYVSILGGDRVDASLFLLARYGYVEPRAPRMLGTCERIYEQLAENGLMYRYRSDDGLPPGEGAFGICGFWSIECAARRGAVDDATAGFERLLACANDLGLFAEEIDPETDAPLGNFPQAFTHVGLIDAAVTLAVHRGDMPARGERREARAVGARP